MAEYNYKCTNEKCENSNGFKIELPMKEAPLKKCDKCGCEVITIFKSVNVNLSFIDSYNSTRGGK